MKINGEVLGVESNGDSLNVRIQGNEERAAEWRPYLRFTLQLPENVKTRKAFFVGRRVRIDVTTL